MEIKASAADAYFINLEKGLLNTLRNDPNDTYRKNNIP